jgi:tetratricopeptide (TPR) repeat protein
MHPKRSDRVRKRPKTGYKSGPVSAKTKVDGRRLDWFLGIGLLVLVSFVYLPIWQAKFIWDDGLVVISNPCIVGPLGLREIWTTSAADICPLTLTLFWFEHFLWGASPLPYHLVNVLMHGASAILLWRVLRGLQIPGAWLGAALWALHPVEVESVAWISEMKNTQSCLFFLLSILFFIRDLDAKKKDDSNRITWNELLTVLFSVLAIASKSSTVVLPAILGLLAWWKRSPWDWRNLRAVLLIIPFSIVAVFVSIWTQGLTGANESRWMLAWPERLIVAGKVFWFYLFKLLYPHPLLMIYPRWAPDSGKVLSYVPLAAGIGLFIFLFFKRKSDWRPIFFAFTYFLVLLVPVLGLVNLSFFRYSFVADHFQYLASIGPLAVIGAGVSQLLNVGIPDRPGLRLIICAGLLGVPGFLSWQHARVFKNELSLWTNTLAGNPSCWAGDNNLGAALLQEGRANEALQYFQNAVANNPTYTEAYNNLGGVLAQEGRYNEAMGALRTVLKINPNDAEAYNNLGNVFVQTGQGDEAAKLFKTAIRIKSDYAAPHSNLGNYFLKSGRMDEAIAEYEEALKIEPDNIDALGGLALALSKSGQVDGAIGQYQKLVAIKPDDVEAHYNFGFILNQAGRLNESIEQYQIALRLDPKNIEAYNGLAIALFQEGQTDKAMALFEEALQLDPNNAETRANLEKAKAILMQGQPPR